MVKPRLGFKLPMAGVCVLCVIFCDDRSSTGAFAADLEFDFNLSAASVAADVWLRMCVFSDDRCVNDCSHTGHLMPFSSEC